MKLFKKIKRVLIVVTILLVFLISIGLFSTLVEADVIDLDTLEIIGELRDNGTSVTSADKQALLDSCEKIAQFYQEHNYTYNSWSGGWTAIYTEQQVNHSCCSIYVLQALVDAGFTDTLGGLDVWYVWDWVKGNPDWEDMGALPEDKMEPGDIQIYKNGGSHTNIFAGFDPETNQGLYWDAGAGGTGAFIGTTKGHGFGTYTCTYRYKY